MGLISDEQTRQTVRRMQLEDGGAGIRDNDLDGIHERPAAIEPPPEPVERPPITELLRNTDMNHSVDTWHNTVPSATDQEEECANVYTHTPDPAVASTGSIDIGVSDTTLVIDDADFVSGDAGENIVVEGADTDGGDLATTIATFTNSTTVELTDPAVTTVAGAVVRWRLRTLGVKNRRVSADQINDTLKTEDHTDFNDVGQITDPKWNQERGVAELGSLNTLCYPFGHYDGAHNSANHTFINLHPLYPGRSVFVRANMARASQYVKLRGRLTMGIWNDHPAAMEYVRGADLTLSVTKKGTPAATVTAIYMLVIETDQGFSIVSDQKTVLNAPTSASFSEAVFNLIRWTSYAGTLRSKLYRKLGAGNVFLVTTINSGTGGYDDRKPDETCVDTGLTTFPNPSNRVRGVRSYFSTAENELDLVPYDGEPGTFWRPIEATLPFPSTVNLGQVHSPKLLIGLTEAPSLYVTDGVAAGSEFQTSAAGQFTADHIGKTAIITDPATGDTLTSEIVDVPDANTLELDDAVGWTSTDNTIEILEGYPHGVLIDLPGAGLASGEWANHPEDLNRPQNVASNPNGSTQGGIGGGDGDTGGGGGFCVLDGSITQVVNDDGSIIDLQAEMLQNGFRVFYGEYDEHGRPKFNVVTDVSNKTVNEIIFVGNGEPDDGFGGTRVHRYVRDEDNFTQGTMLGDSVKGGQILRYDGNGYVAEKIRQRERRNGRFGVTSISLTGPDPEKKNLFLVNGYLGHNSKPPGELLL